MGTGEVSGIGTREVWLAFALSFAIIAKPAGREREFLKSSVIFSRASVEGILIVVPRIDSRSRRAMSGVEAMEVRFVVGVVFNVGREGLDGGKGAEEELLGGKLFMVSVLVSEGRSGGA